MNLYALLASMVWDGHDVARVVTVARLLLYHVKGRQQSVKRKNFQGLTVA